jgi:succinate-semialdehyde dehydrogenase/glutarate-semialdehyde dehydrogenase
LKKISFTGSSLVGKKVMRVASETVKSLSLELGGNAPFLIFKDADIKSAIDGLLFAKFRNAGQTCISANRVYIHSSVYNECVGYLLCRLAELKMGSGFDPKVSIGPIIDDRALTRIERYVNESVKLGAKVIFGGGRWEENLNFYKPTVIVDACDHMPIMQNEIFGPILSISKFNSDAEALARANDSVYGLACYLYTSDTRRIRFFENHLQFGIISVNSGTISSAFIPFGGIKESGFGKEGSKYGINEYLITKCICRHS